MALYNINTDSRFQMNHGSANKSPSLYIFSFLSIEEFWEVGLREFLIENFTDNIIMMMYGEEKRVSNCSPFIRSRNKREELAGKKRKKSKQNWIFSRNFDPLRFPFLVSFFPLLSWHLASSPLFTSSTYFGNIFHHHGNL